MEILALVQSGQISCLQLSEQSILAMARILWSELAWYDWSPRLRLGAALPGPWEQGLL